jgi:hypothetical protein
MKPKKKKNPPKFTAVLASILATLAIYTGALAIFLYVQGWRVDFLDRSIKQVGVLTVESSPTQANIYINGNSRGRTNKSTTLDVGTYEIKVSKDGYYDWEKEVEILEEKSTPVYPYLIKTDFETENIYKSELTLENYWSDRNNNHLLILLKDENSFQLIHHTINTGFWSFNYAPLPIMTIPNDIEEPISNIDLQLSPSGQMAILEVIKEAGSNKYIIPTTRPSSFTSISESPLPLSEFTNYSITWSKDEKFLILDSDTDVISYDLDKGTRHLLFRKVDSLDVWSTDKEGYFYVFRHLETTEENVIEYTLKQYNLDGSSEVTVIPFLYLQNNAEYIENYRETDFNFTYFTNSPESTQTTGTITEFIVNQEVTGIYIQTTEATYWYDSAIGKYITVSPYPAELLEFSPDGDKALIKSDKEYSVFVFDKEEGDHTISIGTQKIANINYDQIEKIAWLSNSSYIQFEEDEFIYIADIDGENKTPLINNENVLYWTVTRSRDELVVLTNSEQEKVSITSYKIR